MESKPDSDSKFPVELENEALIQAIAQTLVDRFDLSSLTRGETPEILQENCYPHYPLLVRLRQASGILTALGLVYSSLNTFHQIIPLPLPASYQIALFPSLLTLCCGLILIVFLILEIFLGAGTDIELKMKQGYHLYQEYRFIPSLNKLPQLLFFLGLGFFAILLGFSSFNSELFRLDPANFDGFREGFIAIYFSIVTFSTVGYGDIHPVSLLAQTSVTCEIFIAMFFNLIALSMTLSWVMAYEQSQYTAAIKKRIEQQQAEDQE